MDKFNIGNIILLKMGAGNFHPIEVANSRPSDHGANSYEVIDTMGKTWIFCGPRVE